MAKLHKPVALVTGGSTGIGEDICRHLLDAGYSVLSLARRATPIEHEYLHSYEVDLADIDATKTLAEELVSQYDVTSIVHNAGVIRPALIENVQLEDFDYLTALHLKTTVALTQAVLPAMKKAEFGRIVIMSSRAILGLETRTSYAATKMAQVALTRTWAMELGRFGITVNAVAPGPIVTDMFHELIPADSPKKDALKNSIPVRRLGYPDDISRAVMFLLAAENSFITGQTLFVCGGTSIGSLSL